MNRCAKVAALHAYMAALNDETKTTERCVYHIHEVTTDCIDVLKLARQFA